MPSVLITGWRPGLNKVQMTLAIRLRSALGLADAKKCTDAVLDGNSATVQTVTLGDAELLVDELRALGAVASVADTPHSQAPRLPAKRKSIK